MNKTANIFICLVSVIALSGCGNQAINNAVGTEVNNINASVESDEPESASSSQGQEGVELPDMSFTQNSLLDQHLQMKQHLKYQQVMCTIGMAGMHL